MCYGICFVQNRNRRRDGEKGSRRAAGKDGETERWRGGERSEGEKESRERRREEERRREKEKRKEEVRRVGEET